MVDSTGVQTDIVANIADWQANLPAPHYATWGDSVMTLYVDGAAWVRCRLPTPRRQEPTPIHVGSVPRSQYRSADGRISNLTTTAAVRAGEASRESHHRDHREVLCVLCDLCGENCCHFTIPPPWWVRR